MVVVHGSCLSGARWGCTHSPAAGGNNWKQSSPRRREAEERPCPRLGSGMKRPVWPCAARRRRPGSPTARRLPDRCGRRRAGQVGAQEEHTEDDLPAEGERGSGARAVAHDRGGTPRRCAADQSRRRGSDRRHTRRPPGYSRHTPPPVRKRERRERAPPGSPWEQRGGRHRSRYRGTCPISRSPLTRTPGTSQAPRFTPPPTSSPTRRFPIRTRPALG